MERQLFVYTGKPFFKVKPAKIMGLQPDVYQPTGYNTALLEAVFSRYFLYQNGFDSWKTIDREVSGPAYGSGASVQVPKYQWGGGGMVSWSEETFGYGAFFTVGVGLDVPLFISVDFAQTEYVPATGSIFGISINQYKEYVNSSGNVTKQHIEQMKTEIRNENILGIPINGNHDYEPRAVADLQKLWNEHSDYFLSPIYPKCRQYIKKNPKVDRATFESLTFPSN